MFFGREKAYKNPKHAYIALSMRTHI